MKILLFTAWTGNAIDMASTVYLANHGFVEANPAMGWLLNFPVLFVPVKLGAMTALLRWLWHNREDRHAKPLAALAAAVYGAIAVYYAVLFARL